MTRLVKKLAPKTEITGIDNNPDRIDYAVKFAKKLRLDIKYECADISSLPFKSGTFDFVWSRFLFEYLKYPIKALKEMRRIAKKGGIVCVGDLDGNCVFHYPFKKSFSQRLQLVVNSLAKFGFDPFVGRKLFSYFKQVGFTKISAKIFPYHNIAGKPDDKSLKNWEMKVDSIGNFLENITVNKGNFIKKFKREFLKYIKNPDTFTYSSLIFIKGEK
jgi:ubiquinone/menaquinone biosynthesis C-methylase UbiE